MLRLRQGAGNAVCGPAPLNSRGVVFSRFRDAKVARGRNFLFIKFSTWP